MLCMLSILRDAKTSKDFNLEALEKYLVFALLLELRTDAFYSINVTLQLPALS